jgi:hypothetical protein
MHPDTYNGRHDLGRNAANFERVNDDAPVGLTLAQRFALVTLFAAIGVAITLMFGLAVNVWLAKAAYLHANPLVGQPW